MCGCFRFVQQRIKALMCTLRLLSPFHSGLTCICINHPRNKALRSISGVREGMSHYLSPSNVALEEKEKKDENKERSKVSPVEESYIYEITVMSRYFCLK